MKWRNIILIIILAIVVFLIQQSFLINFWPINLLLLLVIWFSYWQKSYALLLAFLAGILMGWLAGIIAPAILSFVIVNLLITYLSQHLPLESFSHYFLVTFLGIVIFFIIYYFSITIFNVWFKQEFLYSYIGLSWFELVKTIFFYQVIMTICYLIRSKKEI